MAEAAEQFDDEEAPGSADSATPDRPQLRKLEGGGETSQPNRSWYDANKQRTSPDHDGLSKAEDSPGSSSFYTPGRSGRSGGLSSFSQWAKKRRKRLLIAVSVTLASFAAAVFIFIGLAPLKLLHIVNNLQDRFYSTANNAVQKETDTLLSNYLKRHVIPGIRDCRGSVVDKNCTPKGINGNNLVGRLYKGWRDTRLEAKLAEKGIEIHYDKSANGYHIKLRMQGMNDAGISLEGFENSGKGLPQFLNDTPELDRYVKSGAMTRQQFADNLKVALNEAYKGETRWKQSLIRFKVSRFVEKKYGVKLCVAACKYTGGKLVNNWRDWKAEKKRAAKIFLTQRIVKPRSDMMGIAMLCLLQKECNPIDVEAPDPVNVTEEGCQSDCRENGAPKTQAEKDMEARLEALAANYGLSFTKEQIKGMADTLESLRKNGFTATAIAGVYAKIKDFVFATGSNRAANAEALKRFFGAVGIALTAAYIIDTINDMPAKIEKLNYMMNSTAMAQTWALYRTYVDECNKEGSCDATMFGSFMQSLGPGEQDAGDKDKQLGGNVGAEGTPLYQNTLGSEAKPSVFALLGSKAYADAPNYSYKCANGKPVPAGSMVCAEENLHQTSAIGDGVKALQNDPLWGQLSFAASIINGTAGAIFNQMVSIATSIACKLGICKGLSLLMDQFAGLISFLANETGVTDLLQGILGAFMDKLFPPSPFSQHMSGGRTFDMIAGGADVTGNDFAHNGLGGKKLSTAEVQANVADQYQQDWQEYNHQSFFARMFDSQSKFSPVTRLALAMPSSFHAAMGSFWSVLANPFGFLSGSFNTLASATTGPAYAAPKVVNDPFGVSQYGYPVNDPIFQQDPEAYWEQNCKDGKQTNKWNGDAANYANNTDKLYHMPENTTTNPCLLLQASVAAAGALFTDDVLSPEDTADTTAVGGNTCDSPSFAPYDPGEWNKIPANIQALIEANAEARTSKDCGAIPNAHPSDPNKQYMGEFHYTAAGGFDWAHEVPAACESLPPDSGGPKYTGHKCIGIKYRDPPTGQNSKAIPID